MGSLDDLMAGTADLAFLDDLGNPLLGAPPTTATLVGTGGSQALGADVARSQFGVNGTGLKIGVLSDSFNVLGGAASDEGDGNLPASGVQVLEEGPSGSADEGRAMLELVHQIAPGASLAFHTAFNGEADFAQGITALVNAGCNIIVDDVTYFDEPFFQEDAIAQAIDAAEAKGVLCFSSAGNEASNAYQSAYRSSGEPVTFANGSGTAFNFNPGGGAPVVRQSVTIGRGATITFNLQWDQPFASVSPAHGAQSQLILVLYDQNGNEVANGTDASDGLTENGNAIDLLQFKNNTQSTSFFLSIIKTSGPDPGLVKYIAMGDGQQVSINTFATDSGTVFGHHDALGGIPVGAVDFTNTPNLGVSPPILEPFSSTGPAELLFDTAGNRLASPDVLPGVDFTSVDGIATSVFNPFFGTSAAAPTAAGVAALIEQEDPALTPQQVLAILEQSAIAMPGAPTDGAGAGLIQANKALAIAQAQLQSVSAAAVLVGTGANFFAADEADRFVRTGSQLTAVGSNGSTMALTNWAIDAGSVVVGGGQDFLQSGEHDVFERLSTGQLVMGQFNSGGVADFALFLTNWAIDPGSFVIGAGEDYLHGGEHDVFERLSTGQLAMGEFSSGGVADYALFFTNWAIDAGSVVVGAGEDYLHSGESNVFERLSTGQLVMGEFSASGAADYALFFTNWAVDAGTMVVGAGGDFLGSGERDVFERLSNGQLVMGEFKGSGTADSALFFTTAGGAAFTIDAATAVIGVGRNSANGLRDLELRQANGQAVFVDVNGTTVSAPRPAATNALSASNAQLSQLVQAMAGFTINGPALESAASPLAKSDLPNSVLAAPNHPS